MSVTFPTVRLPAPDDLPSVDALNEAIGQAFAAYRTLRDVGRRELAAWLDMSPATIGAWERGDRQMSAAQMALVEHALRLPSGFLLREAGKILARAAVQ